MIFLLVLKVFIPFIKPMEPIDTKSSKSTPVFSYFLARKTTSLKLCSISLLREYKSPSWAFFIYVSSSSFSNGGGKISALPT